MTAPQEWIDKAEGDYNAMLWLMKSPNPQYDAVVFHAQQCIEKWMKAVLETDGVPVLFTHNLELLAEMIEKSRPGCTFGMVEMHHLQPGATALRYPGYDATPQMAADAAAACETLRTALQAML